MRVSQCRMFVMYYVTLTDSVNVSTQKTRYDITSLLLDLSVKSVQLCAYILHLSNVGVGF